MGSVFLRRSSYCLSCSPGRRIRLSRTADRERCTASGHNIEIRKSKTFWIFYIRGGKGYNESTGFERFKDAKALLQSREGDIAHGKPVTPTIGRLTFEDAAADLRLDFTTNKKKSYSVVERRIRLHLEPFFRRRRMADITTSDVREYISKRQTENSVLVRKTRTITLPDGSTETTDEERRCASNAEINRELATLKRAYNLAIQAGTLLNRPHIPMLRENNTRTGFFEREHYESVVKHLPEAIRPVITFAFITGWRVASEVLPLQWRNVDFDAGEVRLDPGTTKNGEGRTFPMTTELRALLEARKAERDAAKQRGILTPLVFFRLVRERTEQPKAKQITSFTKAWTSACRAAGCPDRIPHDLRRTAVRNLVRAGVPERVCMTLTGHKTRSVFERYNIVSDGDLKDAAKRLDAVALAR